MAPAQCTVKKLKALVSTQERCLFTFQRVSKATCRKLAEILAAFLSARFHVTFQLSGTLLATLGPLSLLLLRLGPEFPIPFSLCTCSRDADAEKPCKIHYASLLFPASSSDKATYSRVPAVKNSQLKTKPGFRSFSCLSLQKPAGL